MTESDIYNTVKPWTVPYGKILRIENAVSVGTVDAILSHQGLALMMEFKVIKSKKIKARRFQVSTAMEYTKNAIPDDQYNFVCSGPESIGIGLYPMSILRDVPYTLTSNDELVFNLAYTLPKHIWRNKNDFDSWIHQFGKCD